MSCSKPLPSFTFDVLCYLNREQLERLSIIYRPLKNLIKRYFSSKPYRIFDELQIREGSYALNHNRVNWHPSRDDYSVQQFLDAQECSIDKLGWEGIWQRRAYYSFAEMRPYLTPTVCIKKTAIDIVGDSTYNPDQINEMESISYLWCDGNIDIWNAKENNGQIAAEDFLPILNSPTILQCRTLNMRNAHFPFKDYKILYTLKVIEIFYYKNYDIDHNYWMKFLEQPGVKPIVVLSGLSVENIRDRLDCISQAFSSAVLPNAFKIVFEQTYLDEPLIEFRKTNKSSGDKLELNKCQESYLKEKYNLECSSI